MHYSGSVSYPASQSGGSVSYSGTAYETVDVVVHVDTLPFDQSVSNCNNTVNGLTASVGAMNAAQCVSIKDSADKVSDAIIDGFFHSIRTDLSAQKAELEQKIEARLMLLRQQAETLRLKKETMQTDYARTSERYLKIFEDLNKELSLRIHELDKPVFSLCHIVDEQSDRMLHTDMVQTAVTAAKENGMLQAQITAALVKNHALETMRRASDFLMLKAKSERLLRQSMAEGSGKDSYFLPVCYMETALEGDKEQREIAVPKGFDEDKVFRQSAMESLNGVDFPEASQEEGQQVQSFLQAEINDHLSKGDEHSERVRETIYKLLSK